MEGVEAADEGAEAAEIATEVPATIVEMVIPGTHPNVTSVARCTKLKIVLSWKETRENAQTVGKVDIFE